MAVDSPTNCWTANEAAFATALANSADFQAFVGVANATEAAARIFVDDADEPWDGEAYEWAQRAQLGAYALVASADDEPFAWTWLSIADCIPEPSGNLIVLFERMVKPIDEHTQTSENASKAQIERWFKNKIGTILKEARSYCVENGGPILQRAQVMEGPFHNDPREWPTHGRWQGCWVRIPWGLLSQS